MKSSTPLQFGHYYHIYNRGNNGGNLFFEERNYPYFLKLYTHHIYPIADTFAYCLLKNHFHFLIRVKGHSETIRGIHSPKPSQAFSNLFNAYSKAINKAYGRTGSLFEERFGRIEVTSETYCMRLLAYIHINPQKHGFVPDFRLWPWSSYHALQGNLETKLARPSVRTWFGNGEHFEDAHQSIWDDYLIAPLVIEDLIS